MDQRELESELQNMMKLHDEGVKQVKKMERIVRESDQRAKVSATLGFKAGRETYFSVVYFSYWLITVKIFDFRSCKLSFKFLGCQG